MKHFKPCAGLDAVLLFFDNVVFVGSPDWSEGYCSAYHFANKGKAESRRQALKPDRGGQDARIPRLRHRSAG